MIQYFFWYTWSFAIRYRPDEYGDDSHWLGYNALGIKFNKFFKL